MMLAADMWGDIPYREAVSATALADTTPAFDGQMQVYEDLLALLDKGITDLGGAGTGPGTFDLVYGGNKAKWIAAAHTLKARVYLHRVEKLGNAEYTKALTEANLGISSPDNDWKTVHSAATSERNMWAQFQNTSFGADLAAGAALVNIMNTQNDSRRSQYFGTAPGGGFVGFDVVTALPAADKVSKILGSGRTNQDDFPQPIITYDETQLIIAEASLQTGGAANAAAAFNRVRARFGKAAIAAPTLNDIMTEKYIALYQNPEVWNDYKRTCLPALRPARGNRVIPGRFYYGASEEQTNPHTPTSAAQDITLHRNANDPNACP
jgi:hypothetical protein